jgi:nicotinamide riboside kinase
MKKTICVNLWGSPGCGKSTVAAGVFYELKRKMVNIELVCEYAKDLIWSETTNLLTNQVHILGEQHNRMFHLKDKVDVIVTDSPFLMGVIYADYSIISPSFEKFVVDEFNRPEIINLNFLIKRVRPYVSEGRLQDEAGADAKGREIIALLEKHNIEYTVLEGKESTVPIIVETVIKMLGK